MGLFSGVLGIIAVAKPLWSLSGVEMSTSTEFILSVAEGLCYRNIL